MDFQQPQTLTKKQPRRRQRFAAVVLTVKNLGLIILGIVALYRMFHSYPAIVTLMNPSPPTRRLPPPELSASCDLEKLKATIQSKRFVLHHHQQQQQQQQDSSFSNPYSSVYHSATLKEVTALAKAELLLQYPFIDTSSFPPLLLACEEQLRRDMRTSLAAETAAAGASDHKFLYGDTVLKQIFLEDLLDLSIPEIVTTAVLQQTSSTSSNEQGGKSTPTNSNTKHQKKKQNEVAIIDIGANTGQFALPLAKEGYTVYSFEPVSSTCEIFKENVKKTGMQDRVKVTCAGVNDVDEIKTFGYLGDKDKPPLSSSFQIIDPTLPNAQVMSTVRTAPIESFFQEDGKVDDPINKALDSVHLFKTDTQGNEEAVLRGARSLLGRTNSPRFVLVEFSHILLHKAGGSPRKVLELLYEADYVCTHLQYHHPVSRTPHIHFKVVDTPEMMTKIEDGHVAVSLDTMVRSIGSHRTWAVDGKRLNDDVQDWPGGWTDLLCFS